MMPLRGLTGTLSSNVNKLTLTTSLWRSPPTVPTRPSLATSGFVTTMPATAVVCWSPASRLLVCLEARVSSARLARSQARHPGPSIGSSPSALCSVGSLAVVHIGEAFAEADRRGALALPPENRPGSSPGPGRCWLCLADARAPSTVVGAALREPGASASLQLMACQLFGCSLSLSSLVWLLVARSSRSHAPPSGQRACSSLWARLSCSGCGPRLVQCLG